jgi:hypothetical protein
MFSPHGSIRQQLAGLAIVLLAGLIVGWIALGHPGVATPIQPSDRAACEALAGNAYAASTDQVNDASQLAVSSRLKEQLVDLASKPPSSTAWKTAALRANGFCEDL